MNLIDRIHGCLAGLTLGDCLGMPTEFLTPAQIQEEFGWVSGFVQAPTYHPHRVLGYAQITDDTGQMLAVSRAYRTDGQLHAEDVARELLVWADGAGEFLSLIIGPSTRQALDQLRAGEDLSHTGRRGKTNGACNRAVVPGLVNYLKPEKLIKHVVQACLPTHNTSVAISGGAAVACAVARALVGDALLDDLFKAAKEGATKGQQYGEWVWGTPLEGRIDLALQIAAKRRQLPTALTDLYRYVGVDMLVAESVAAAFGVIALANGNPMNAVVYGANIGGDTDTIAAIAGAICGAWQGIEAIDPEMLAEIERINHLNLAAEAARLYNIVAQQE